MAPSDMEKRARWFPAAFLGLVDCGKDKDAKGDYVMTAKACGYVLGL